MRNNQLFKRRLFGRLLALSALHRCIKSRVFRSRHVCPISSPQRTQRREYGRVWRRQRVIVVGHHTPIPFHNIRNHPILIVSVTQLPENLPVAPLVPYLNLLPCTIVTYPLHRPIACDGFYQLADIVVLKANFHPVLVGDGDADGETSYTYDADGNLVQQVNVNGTVEWISYDGAGWTL